MDEGDDVTQTNDADDSDEGDDVDWLSVLLWNCELFDCVPVGTLLILVKNFAIGLCLDLLFIDEATVLVPADIVIGKFKSAAGLFSFITDIFNFCTGKLISSAVLFGGARI